MVKVTERCFETTGRTTFICDFSPPRGGATEAFVRPSVDADFISVAYNPGKAVRVNSAMLAAFIRYDGGHNGNHNGEREVTFTLATRDMNKLALQSLLLGAQLLGVENVVVVQGDPFSERDLQRVKDVGDYTATGLIAAIVGMNQGTDYREGQLRAPTDFCIGATLDLTRDIQHEARLAHRKVVAGAHFLITQPIFDVAEAQRLKETYAELSGQELNLPVFFGLPVLEKDGIIFSSVPEQVRRELDQDRSGVDIALELYQRFLEAGLNNIYLVPPIRRGGARNYAAAQRVLDGTGRN